METNILLQQLTNEQLALIMGEKVSERLSGGAKRDTDVIKSADIFLKWLNDNKSKV